MCVKFFPEDLNPALAPLHFTSIYTCGVTIVLRVCGGNLYEKPTKAKSNFDSNQIFSKFWLYIYIYIYLFILDSSFSRLN